MDEGVWMNKNDGPLVSIIVPVYNVEDYIETCILSITRQSYENLEIILVDDCSSDGSLDICKKIATFDKRIKLFVNKENSGVSYTRNKAISLSNGDYITFVDSDDYIAPDMIEKMLNVAVDSNADMVKSGFKEFNNKGEIIKVKKFSKEECFENENVLPLYFKGVLFTIPCATLYKRELALKVNFPEGKINEDNYTSGMYLFNSKKVVCIPGTFYFYRVNPNGLSKGARKRLLLDIAIVTAKLHEDLIEKGLNDEKFLLLLESKFAKDIFHCIKYGQKGVFRLCSMDKCLYDFVLSRLDLYRRWKMQLYKALGKFMVK